MPESTSQSKHAWHKSSYSSAKGQDCVEVAEGVTTSVRDTQHRELGALGFPAAEWAALLADLKK